MTRKLMVLMAIPGLVLALALAGCSSTLDTEKAQNLIKKGIADQTGVKISSVDCPKDVEIKKGDKFKCSVKAADGTTGKVTVTQQDDEGNVTWTLDP